MSWLSNLGEKKSRTDLWVILIVVQFITCHFGIVQCTQNWYVDLITIGMFADLGIDSVVTKVFNRNGSNNK